MKLNFTLLSSISSIQFIICLIGMEKFEKVRVNEKNFAMVTNLHGNWYSASLKAIIGKLGSDLYKKLRKEEQKELEKCLDSIEDKRDLVESSQCLTKFRKNHLREKNKAKLKMEEKRMKKIGAFAIEQSAESEPKIAALENEQNAKLKKRNSPHFEQLTSKEYSDGSMKWLSNFKNERNDKKYENFQKAPQVEKRSQNIYKIKIKQLERQDKLLSRGDRSTLFKATNLIDKLFGKNEKSTTADQNGNSPKWTQLYDALVKIKMINDQKRKTPGARVYEMRMYDLVLTRNEPSLGPKEKKSGSGILKMGMQLLNKLRNSTSATANFKIMSPRFVPLLPEAAEPNGAAEEQHQSKTNLSPTILALYDLNSEEKAEQRPATESAIASLPQLLKSLGVTSQDRDALLHTLLDISGSIGHVQKAMELLKALNFFEIENDLADANTRIVNAFTNMEQTFDEVQRQEMQQDGWTFLRHFQYDKLCRDQYAEFPDEFRHSFDQFSKISREMREAMLWKRIERISRNIPDNIADKLDQRRMEKNAHLWGQRRRKRQQSPPPVGGINVLNPILLQPFMFSPALTPTVLGPIVLSPNIFSPIILAPSVLSPFILSPSAPMPLILSPYVLSPYILSPMAMAPVILTPYVLSPNILNPFAMSPLILSPTVLSPDILSPQILGGAILSPTVGSPAILTETFLMASVLSPSVLS